MDFIISSFSFKAEGIILFLTKSTLNGYCTVKSNPKFLAFYSISAFIKAEHATKYGL